MGTYDQLHFLLHEPLKTCLASRITAVSTIFGWTVAGPSSTTDNITALTVKLQNNHLDELLAKSWELKKVPSAPKYQSEEESALQQFQQTVSVTADGRYMVGLPRVNNSPNLSSWVSHRFS